MDSSQEVIITKYKLLDLFCGAGGASAGYAKAGFEVVGVDLHPQKRYPFEFVQWDAVEILKYVDLSSFHAIHASPPCQHYSHITKVWGVAHANKHPDLIPEVRTLLSRTGNIYVIENVPTAPLINPIQLCGSSFPLLEVRRHRLFESNIQLTGLPCDHASKPPAVPVYGHTGSGANRGKEKARGRTNGVADWKRAMQIDWMIGDELAEAIPPAYTEHIGKQLISELKRRGV